MIDLLIFALMAYGITNILVYGSIFNKFRDVIGVNDENPGFFGKLFGCMMCLPFWVGIFLSLTIYSPTYMLDGDASMYLIPDSMYRPFTIFLDGCLTSGLVWLIHTLQEYFEG